MLHVDQHVGKHREQHGGVDAHDTLQHELSCRKYQDDIPVCSLVSNLGRLGRCNWPLPLF